MLNKVMLIGRLGRDPEVRYTGDGTAVCNFSIATSEVWNSKDGGGKKESTEWHNIVAWRKLAEVCGEHLYKGKLVYLEGKMQTRSWEKDGVTQYKTEINAFTVRFLSQDQTPRQQESPAPQQQQAGYNESNYDEEIPF